jgi:RNase P/RNase MRP subunit p30
MKHTQYFDIITFDCFDKLPFIPKLNIVQEMVKAGIYFEINYSDAIQGTNGDPQVFRSK